MSKELEALERIRATIRIKGGISGYELGDLDIIDTALKEYENLQLKHRSMQDAVLDDFKKLKALAIIKNKRVDIVAFIRGFIEGHDTYNDYYENADEYHYYRKDDYELRILSQKQFYLLKEVLL